MPTPQPEEAPVAVSEPEASEAPDGYDGMTVAQVSSAAKEWTRAQLEAARAYELAHQARKGALAALESALAKEEG